MASPTSTQGQVRISLSTKRKDISLPDTLGSILVSTVLTRTDLSRIVNELLETKRRIPLEFLADGIFVRGSLEEYLVSRGISSETTLRLEYQPAATPPLWSASYHHDDWVSSVDVLSVSSLAGQNQILPSQERIISGCNNGLFQIWNMSSEILATSPSSNDDPRIVQSVTAVKFISPSRLVSSTFQGDITIWDYDSDVAVLSPQTGLHGHRSKVTSLAVSSSSTRILSGSYDNTVGFWSTERSENPEAPSVSQSQPSSSKTKKSKKSSSIPGCGALSMLKGHTDIVSASIFSPTDNTVAYSSSQDHKVITWDLTTAKAVDTRVTPSALFALAALPTLNFLAVGASPCHITLIDPRASATTVTAMTLRGHSNQVVSLANDPTTSYHLLSGSHDGTCKIWDLRSLRREGDGSTAPVSRLSIPRESQEGKRKPEQGGESSVLAVAWDRDVGIISGGIDGNLDIHRASE